MERLAQFVESIQFADFSEETVTHAKSVTADTLGVIIGGSTETENQRLAKFGCELGSSGTSTLFTQRFPRVDRLTAAFVNAAAGVSLELDEGHRFFGMHGAIALVPSLFALGEHLRVSGKQFLTSLILGYEVAARLAGACPLKSGLNNHGTWVTMGCAAACAKMKGLNAKEIEKAIDLSSCLVTPNPFETYTEGATVRNVALGLAARAGILAVELLDCSFQSFPNATKQVCTRILGDTLDEDKLTRGLGQPYEITRNYFKRDACCSWTHPPLNALNEALTKTLLAPDDIARIEVGTHPKAARLSRQQPMNALAAKFSIPYVLAARLVLGRTDAEAFRGQALQNPQIRELARKVFVTVDASSGDGTFNRPATVTIHTTHGSILHAHCPNPVGDFQNPFPRDILVSKFTQLTTLAMSAHQSASLLQQLGRMDTIKDLSELIPSALSGNESKKDHRRRSFS